MKAQASLHGSRLDVMQSSYGPLSQDAPIRLPFQPGEIIAGKYEMMGLIGSGGMGYVISARHIELGEPVAIKFLRAEAMAYEELVGRFAREAQASVRIKSEHVARVYDVGTLPDGTPFIVMEYLEGKNLGDVVQERGRLPIKVAVEYVMQACEALASAHAIGTVHRDVKPENLFLTRQGQGVDVVKVLDFGISKVALSGAMAVKRQFVRTTMPIGSPVYMSPEQIRSSENVDARTDIWSLGCVLFELLTGTTAFDAPTLMELGAVILGSPPVPLRSLLPEAPVELEAIVTKCLEKDASKRFQHIAELGIALYPFAPRRARISAERCHSLLKGTDPTAAELELASIAPPSSVNATVLRSLMPRSTSIRTTSASPASVGGVEVLPNFRPQRRGIGLSVAAVAVIALAFIGGPHVMRWAAPDARPATAQLAADVPVPPAVANAGISPDTLPAEPVPTPEIDIDAVPTTAAEAKPSEGTLTDPAQKAKPADARARRSYRPPPVVRPVAPPAAAPVKPKATPARAGEELDVGF